MTAANGADYHHLTRVELARLGDVPADQLDLPIPHIEGWTVHAVVGHTGWVCRWVELCLGAEADAPPARAAVAEPPAGSDVIEWFNEGRERVVAALEAADPDHLRPTFTGPQPASWWMRRMANEASMHRWDAYSAGGSPDPIDSHLAVDGIDEVFEVFAPHRLQFPILDAAGSTIHLHGTDLDHGEWMVRLADDHLTWERAHEKGDVAARGPVSDILLLLWSRIPPSRLELFGDSSLLDRWQQAARF